MVALNPRVSKFRIGDLALDSALELERARISGQFTAGPLEALANALQQTSFDPPPGSMVSSMRPGYFEPFDRVQRSHSPSAQHGTEDIRALVDWAIAELKRVAQLNGIDGQAGELVNFCVQLHQEFVGRPAAEARFGRTQRSIPSSAGLS